jgi:transposase
MRKSKIEEGKMNKKAQELKMLEKILNLPSIMIKAYHEFEGIGWIFEVESSGKKSICPRCGQTSEHLHKNHGHLVKDLPICGKITY